MQINQTKLDQRYTYFCRLTFYSLYEDILEEAKVDDNDKAAEKRIIFLKLEEYAHICSQSEILACPNIDQRGICQQAAAAPSDNQDGVDVHDDHDGENDSVDDDIDA